MAKDQSKQKESSQTLNDEPRSFEVFDRGVRTDDDMTNGLSRLMSDLIRGRIPPNIGNAVCNASGKILKTVEMKYKYGTTTRHGGTPKTLVLAPVQCAGCGATIPGAVSLDPEQKPAPEYCDTCKRKTLEAK